MNIFSTITEFLVFVLQSTTWMVHQPKMARVMLYGDVNECSAHTGTHTLRAATPRCRVRLSPPSARRRASGGWECAVTRVYSVCVCVWWRCCCVCVTDCALDLHPLRSRLVNPASVCCVLHDGDPTQSARRQQRRCAYPILNSLHRITL